MAATPEEITAQITANETAIAEFQASANEALATLQSDAALPFLQHFDFAAIPVPEIGGAPKVGLGALASFQAATMTSAPEFVYTPQMFDALEAQVMDIVNSGGQNVTPAVQDAVFNQGYERLIQSTKDLLDLTGARTGAKGCRYANSMTKAQQNEIALNFAWQRNDTSRNITQTMGDLIQRNLSMAISAGVSLQQAQTDLAIKTYTVLLDGQRLVLERFKVDTDAAITLFDARLKSTMAQLEADMDNAKLTIEQQGQVIELFRSTSLNLIEEGRSQIQQMVEENRLRIEMIKAVAETYAGLSQSLGNQTVSILK
jgi:hypothetical protein